MASEVKTDKVSPSGGTALQIGDASDTITIPTGATLTVTDGIGVASGGTGLASFTAGDVLYATGTTTLAKLAKGTAEQILSMNSGATAPEWATAAATAGGTGQTAFTAGDLLYANSTTTLTKLGKGTGLQGLQTNSGATAPEWANSPQSLMTAAGDILYASGANTLAKLAKGSDDEVLTLASGVPSWAESAGGGKIAQVKTAVQTAVQTVSSASYVDIPGLTLAITPAATTSKILWNFSCNVGTTAFVYIKPVYGGGGDLTTVAIADADSSHQRSTTGNGADPTGENATCMSMMGLDSPATTSETTYKLQWVTDTSGSQCYMNRMQTDTNNANYGHSISTLTIMEVLA